MKYKLLNGNEKNLQNEISLIKKTIEDNNDLETIFVFNGTTKLYTYIDKLLDNGVDDITICKLKICYERKGLRLSVNKEKGKTVTIDSMSKLLDFLDKESNTRIVVDNNSREDLAFVVQQLIYVQYPLEKIDILLRKEEQDAEKVKRFMNRIERLINGCNTAQKRLGELGKRILQEEKDEDVKKKCQEDVKKATESCKEIDKNLVKAKNVDLKIAVTASKKTGKSVMVNCFIGEEIAPTSIQLATPNNCIYRASKDRKYHLNYEGKKGDNVFNSKEAIYEAIEKEFKKAENNSAEGFKTNDMNIGYVTEKNNFSSYTIYDTPGPDAAGTGHREAAIRALKKCDVAIFAIDYAKYLTECEKEYLDKDVKQTFEEQNKFHTLMFALNKMDVRYNDTNCTKSLVKAVDFIRTRLAELGKIGENGEKDDKAYRDCIIFPTCSLEYFYAIDAEKSGADELKEEDDIGCLRKITKSHKNIESLQWLYKHSLDLERYHDLETISYDIFKEDSGMPALMKYASYIAKSKARAEIVNYLAFQIDTQSKRLDGIIAYISNLEKFINMDKAKIAKITEIINGYKNETEKLLKLELNGNELKQIFENNTQSGVGNSFEDVKNKNQIDVSNSIKDSFKLKDISTGFYDYYVEQMFDRIEKCNDFNQVFINDLFKEWKFNMFLENFLKNKFKEKRSLSESVIARIGRIITEIIENRLNGLKKLSVECRAKLAKQGVCLELPEISSFTPDIPVPSFEQLNCNISEGKVKVSDSIEFERPVTAYLKGILAGGLAVGAVWLSPWLIPEALVGGLGGIMACLNQRKKPENIKEFEKICEKMELEGKILKHLTYNNIPDQLASSLNELLVDGYMNKCFDEIREKFENINKTYIASVNDFSQSIDDRDKYQENIAKFKKHKDVIDNIKDSTSDFMKVWNEVMNGVSA